MPTKEEWIEEYRRVLAQCREIGDKVREKACLKELEHLGAPESAAKASAPEKATQAPAEKKA